jgi:hypothetical protein
MYFKRQSFVLIKNVLTVIVETIDCIKVIWYSKTPKWVGSFFLNIPKRWIGENDCQMA